MERRLNQPFLPQMSDGVITQGDLETSKTIYVAIHPYTNVRVNDFIVLHFGNLPPRSFMVSDPDAAVVVVFDIEASSVPDGDYLVWYEVQDEANNSTGPSPSGWAVVNRNDNGTLEAPVFIDADTSHSINEANIMNNEGTNVNIPVYTGMSVGDALNLLFFVTDSNDKLLDNSQYAVSHKVTDNDLQSGVTLLVPAPYILVPGGITCHARYHVDPANGTEDRQSLTGDATLLLMGTDILPAPIFTDAVYGWLTEDQTNTGIHIQASWADIAINDSIVMHLEGFSADGSPVSGASSTQTRTVTTLEAEQRQINFTFDRSAATAVNLGRLNAWYSVNTERTSVAGSVNVDLVHTTHLPPPLFTQAQNGLLDEEDIITDNGALVRIQYPGMSTGDVLSVYVTGKNLSGQNVPGASTLLSSVISQQETTAGYVNIIIPQENALAPGELGTLHAQYTIDYNNSGFGFSTQTEVILNMSTSSSMALVIASGSPIHDNQLQINPENKGKLFGPPGAGITLSCSSPALFVESGSDTYTVTIDREGEARFSLRSTETGEFTILATDLETSQSVVGYTTFTRYQFSPNAPGIQSWGVSSGSSADGTMPDTIYVVAEDNPQVEHVLAFVTAGSATFLETGEQTQTFLLNADNTVSIELIDTNPGQSSVRLSLPESSGNVIDVVVNFVQQPEKKEPLRT
jgi:hypothetical protein